MSQGRHLMDEFLHAVRALLTHPFAHMAVYIKGECGCRMSKVLLNRLDIIAVFQRDDCISMTKVMETKIRKSKFCDNPLKLPVYRAVDQMSTKLVGKDQIHGIGPCRPRSKL